MTKAYALFDKNKRVQAPITKLNKIKLSSENIKWKEMSLLEICCDNKLTNISGNNLAKYCIYN